MSFKQKIPEYAINTYSKYPALKIESESVTKIL